MQQPQYKIIDRDSLFRSNLASDKQSATQIPTRLNLATLKQPPNSHTTQLSVLSFRKGPSRATQEFLSRDAECLTFTFENLVDIITLWMTREVFVAENKGQIVECMLPVLLNHLLQMNVDMGGKKYKIVFPWQDTWISKRLVSIENRLVSM